MDKRTGELHELKPGETIGDLARRLGAEPEQFTLLAGPPDENCQRPLRSEAPAARAATALRYVSTVRR